MSSVQIGAVDAGHEQGQAGSEDAAGQEQDILGMAEEAEHFPVLLTLFGYERDIKSRASFLRL
ncbi:hypothetical protein [Pseudomonas sp. Y24-6]|uniref:hypothetical protein n=1 Tax=Pseudomonas sp. Y24-6 TaxID=2750013 RepID=UPI001CE0953D|nr:hypothetical protein [Pseudomonas sp. Y24-6]MCA4963478.1 hypothetical protein [Pseudomonas sp. Y24-6]